MSRSKVAVRLAGAAVLALACSGPAAADSLSQFGMWGGPPKANPVEPSKLGGPALVKPVALASGGGRPAIAPRTPASVGFANGFQPGSIIIDTAGRKLYYTLSHSRAYVYPIAVGKQGFAWTGVERVSRIEDWPDWIPPKEMHQRKRGLPLRMTGGLNNPLGARAIYLGNTLYRIHGTNDARSIGSASSSGCFRMHNAHVVHLADHVTAATVVFVMRSLPKSGTAMPPPGYLPAVKAPAEPAAPAEAAAPEAPDAGVQAPAAAEQPADQGI